MIDGAWFLARADFFHMLRQRETILWIFIMPVVFFYFIGMVTGGSRLRSQEDRRETLALWGPDDGGFLADQLAARLEKLDFRVVRAESEQEWAGHRRRLRLPERFTEKVLAGEPVKPAFEREGSAADAGFDEVRVMRAVYSELGDLIVAGKDGAEITEESLTKVAETERTLEVAVSAAGELRRIPSGFEQAIPGITVMFTLIVMFTTGGISLVVERRGGLLRRLASSPMSRASVVAGKWGARMMLGVIQIGIAMLTGWALFDIPWGPNRAVVILVLFSYGALVSALGVLLGNIAKTEGQAAGVGVLAANALAALGGCWWPIEVTPEWAQQLSMLLPTGWAMDALHKLMSFGAPPSSVAPHVAALLASAALAGYAVSRTFRFQ
jgi:ABC-type Na+ efflux pump permease subunit